MSKYLLISALLVLAACSDRASVTDLGLVKKPAGHDQVAAAPTAVRKVDVPAEVRARFKSVVVSVAAHNSPAVRLEVPLGGRAESSGAGIVVMAKDYLPSFVIMGDTITNRQGGGPAKNPSVWLEVQVKGQKVFNGWAFRDYPELTSPLVTGYSIKLLSAKIVTAK